MQAYFMKQVLARTQHQPDSGVPTLNLAVEPGSPPQPVDEQPTKFISRWSELRLPAYDGTTALDTYLAQVEHTMEFSGWSSACAGGSASRRAGRLGKISASATMLWLQRGAAERRVHAWSWQPANRQVDMPMRSSLHLLWT